MQSIKVGTAEANPGSRGNGYLKIGEMADGSPVNIPVIILNGVEEGPCLWVQAAIHGPEVFGSFAISQLVSMLDPKKMSGTLIAIPATNILGIRWHTRGIDPSGYLHNVDLNLSFPGHSEGDFNEQAASILLDQIQKHANYLIDFHGTPKVWWSLCYDNGSEASKEALSIAKYFGIETIVVSKSKGEGPGGYSLNHLVKMPFAVATMRGIPSIIVEVSERESWEDDLKDLKKSMKNVMKYLKIIKGQGELKEHYTIIEQVVDIKSKHGGIFIPLKKDRAVSEGELMGTITNIFGETITEIRSPISGIVLSGTRHASRFVGSGTMLYHLGVIP
jgi:predicted deacylase